MKITTNTASKIKLLCRYFINTGVILVAVGYLSSVMCEQKCEDTMATTLAREQMQGNEFFVKEGTDSSIIFARIGAKFRLYTGYPTVSKKMKFVTWPDGAAMLDITRGGKVASVSRVQIMYPFLASVDYSSVAASLDGGSGVRTYLCLFGFVFRLYDKFNWVS